jgi:hypothetical protein
MPHSPHLRALVWLIYTFVIAELGPFAILWYLSSITAAPPNVLQSYLGMTTMVLLGYGVLVAATGDRLIDRGFAAGLLTPLMWILGLLGLSTYFLYKQYIAGANPDRADLIVTCCLGFLALAAAVWIKFDDWQQAYSFSRQSRDGD